MDERPADSERFLSLVEAHQRPLHKVCWTYAANSHDREDLWQEIVGRLWRAFGTYDSHRSFSTWMYRVALNVAIDYRRKRRRWEKEATKLAATEQALSANATESASHRWRMQELRELMERQSDVDRVLLLLHLEGHSHREIGDILGISESNVGTRMNRLKNALRQSVDEQRNEKKGDS